MGLGAFVSVGRSLETALQRVELAERLGYESVLTTHIASRDSLTLLMAYAARTERVKIGTGVMPIYSRPPATTAMAAATVDEFSGGRLILGLGVSHRPTVEGWYGDKIEKPVREMREYVEIVRAILGGEDPPEGERWRTAFHFMGFEPRPDIPVYIAALSPGMLRLAGEIGDGVVLWLCNPEYIEQVVVPETAKGRERGERAGQELDIVAAVPSAVTPEPDEARAKLRQELIHYFSLPFYRAMIERSGYEEDVKGFDKGMQSGDTEAAVAAISDRFLNNLGAIGSPEEAAASLRRYQQAGATSPCVGAVAGTDFNSTLEALAGALG
jgi:alkanesulfonate monooxygenase SsuD/methylene tetrahydromethanopterin reductase-like flavin-dependent oxidoreductase (luciferase family)